MRALMAGIVLAVSLGTGVADAAHCDSNPECNAGRGSVPAFICVRSEVNPVSNEFNGRVCTWSQQQGTWYFYLRWIYNREPVTVCRDGQQVYPPASPSNTSTCRMVGH